MRNVSCKTCGKIVRIKPSEKGKKLYCSVPCQRKGTIKTMTSPHRKTVEILKKNRIWYENEYRAGRFLLDVYLGKTLGIEVQGSYWHGDIRLYPKPKNEIQKKADKRDKRKKLFLEEKGIAVLYIWEKDIDENPEVCKKLILRFFERNGKLSNYHSMNYKVDRGKLVLNRKRLVPRFEI